MEALSYVKSINASSPVTYITIGYIDLAENDNRHPFQIQGIYPGYKYALVANQMKTHGWKEVHRETRYSIYEKGNYLVSFVKGYSQVQNIYVINKKFYPSNYNYKKPKSFHDDLLPNYG